MSKANPSPNTEEAEVSTILDEFEEPRHNTAQATGNERRHTDADSIRRHFGIPPFDPTNFSHPVVVDNWIHTIDGSHPLWEEFLESADTGGHHIKNQGGSDFLAIGKFGSGKSTFANFVATRMIEINNEAVVWAGSQSRAEWLPLAPWTTLCLPADVGFTAHLEPRDKTLPVVPLGDGDLERIVRDVKRYEDPIDLNRNVVEPGKIHVVYPDPMMRRCEAIYQESPDRTYEAPRGREQLFHQEDPDPHWWFAWFLSRLEHGPFHPFSWIVDEVGDIMEQGASKDQFGTFQKVKLVSDALAEARKYALSVFALGQDQTDVHEKFRRKLRWRVQLPGQANPTSKSEVVGFNTIPMDQDITSSLGIGQGLMYTESTFSKFSWPDMSIQPNYKLRLRLQGVDR